MPRTWNFVSVPRERRWIQYTPKFVLRYCASSDASLASPEILLSRDRRSLVIGTPALLIRTNCDSESSQNDVVTTSRWCTALVSLLGLHRQVLDLDTTRKIDMIASIGTVFAVGLLSYCYIRIRSLFHYIADAKDTGLPYVILTVHVFGFSWALLRPVTVPVLCCLPGRLTEKWLPEFPCNS